jgi:GTP-binding protein Era
MTHKAGFVNIIGKPNVGKSTLMNMLIGEKLSIITPKAQTTRHRILGIANGCNYQVVFSDTPGILKPKYKLQEKMMNFIENVFSDADILLFLTDIDDKFEHAEIIEKINQLNLPIILAINKIDLSNQERVTELINHWKTLLPKVEIFAMSALHNHNIKELFERILELLPENPAFYPKDDLSDRNTRFFVSEIIREKILMQYSQEIPYSVEVVIEAYEEGKKVDKIQAIIYVERDSQKGIIIGHKGEALKRVGTNARKDIEKLVGKQVFLELFVKVKKDWRNNESALKGFGYQ